MLQALQLSAPAVAALSKALELQPHHGLAIRAQVQGLQKLGRAIEAITLLQRAASHDPGHWEDLFDLGNSLYVSDLYRSASKAYEAALSGVGARAELHTNLSATQLAMEQPQLALLSAEKALQLQPAYPEALVDQSMALRLLDRPAEALVASEQALALQPDFINAHLARGRALRDLLRPEEALVACSSAHALQPDNPKLQADLALSLQECGRLAEALHYFELALAGQPDNADIQANRGICLLLASDQRQGWDDYEARHLDTGAGRPASWPLAADVVGVSGAGYHSPSPASSCALSTGAGAAGRNLAPAPPSRKGSGDRPQLGGQSRGGKGC